MLKATSRWREFAGTTRWRVFGLIVFLMFLSSRALGQSSETSGESRYAIRFKISPACYNGEREKAKLMHALGEVASKCMTYLYSRKPNHHPFLDYHIYRAPVRTSVYLAGKPTPRYEQLSCDALVGFVENHCDEYSGDAKQRCVRSIGLDVKESCLAFDDSCGRRLRYFFDGISYEGCGVIVDVSTNETLDDLVE